MDGTTSKFDSYSGIAASNIAFQTNLNGQGATEKMRIIGNGNVGIGTATPQAKLHVYAQDNSVASILSETSNNNNRFQIRNYVTTQVNQPVFRLQHTFYGSVENNGFIDFLRGESSDGGFLALGTNGTEKLRINTIGNVGIGTITPNSLLTVKKDQNSPSSITISNLGAASPNTIMQFLLSEDGSSTHGYLRRYRDGTGNVELGYTDNLVFKGGVSSTSTEHMRINPNGNVGIGTTSPTEKLEITGNMNVSGQTWIGPKVPSYAPFNINQPTPYMYSGMFAHTDPSVDRRMMFGVFNNIIGIQAAVYSNGNNTSLLLNPGGGDVGIGTTTLPAGYKLAINGNAIANKVVVKQFPWADFVFKPEYELPPLSKVEDFIKKNGHLPEIPNEAEVKEKGIDLGSMEAKLLQKVEELTLYLLQQQKRMEKIEIENQNLAQRVKELEKKQ